jgi:hypothetical protein
VDNKRVSDGSFPPIQHDYLPQICSCSKQRGKGHGNYEFAACLNGNLRSQESTQVFLLQLKLQRAQPHITQNQHATITKLCRCATPSSYNTGPEMYLSLPLIFKFDPQQSQNSLIQSSKELLSFLRGTHPLALLVSSIGSKQNGCD